METIKNWGQGKILDHYESHYFNNFQKEVGEFGGLANKFMFENHVLPHHVVLDFGCGGGFLLQALDCNEKIGIEINPAARDYCNFVTGIRCYPSLEYVSPESVDVVISSHCLEHTSNPFEIVEELYEKLKPGGTIVIMVPLDSHMVQWSPNDVNNHLYSFSPMNLGNILQATGFTNIMTGPIFHKWTPRHRWIREVCGKRVFHQLSWLYGFVNRNVVQIRGIGTKQRVE